MTSNWTSLTSLRLLLVILVIARLLTGVQSIDRCDVSFVLVPDANVMGGTQRTAVSNVTECEFVCTQMTSCVGFDWNRKDNGCFLLTSGVELINYNFSGVDHYSLLRDSNSCHGACSFPRWVPIVNSHCFGGRALGPVFGLSDCAEHCMQNASCFGFDWDPRNSNGQKCWIISDVCPLPGPASGVFYYAKTCTPITGTASSASSSVASLPFTAVQTLRPTVRPTTHPTDDHSTVTFLPSSFTTTTTTTSIVTLLSSTLPKSSSTTITRLPGTSTKPSASSITTSTTSKTTLPVGVSISSFSSTTTTHSIKSSITTTTTQSALSSIRAFVSLPSGTESTVARGEADETSSNSADNGGATISTSSVTSGIVHNTTTNDTINSNSITSTLNTPTQATPKMNAVPVNFLNQGQHEQEHSDYPVAIKPTYIVLAGLGGGCLLLVLTAVATLCQYPLSSEEDSMLDRGYKSYEVNSNTPSNDIVDMDFFDIEHNPEFRASGVVAPEFEATSVN